MESPNSPREDPRLSALLHSWTVPSTAPPRFAEQVWARLGQTTPDPAISVWDIVRSWLTAALRNPRVATAYVALLLALGAGAGALRGHSAANAMAGDLQARYVQSIDPFAALTR